MIDRPTTPRYPEGVQPDKSLYMSQKATRIGLTCVVIAVAFGGLLYSTLSEGTEY